MIELSKEAIQQRHETIIALSKQGVSIGDICRAVKLSRRPVMRVRAKAGLAQKYSQAGEDEKLQAKQLLADGCSYEEVARTIGRASSTVAKWHPGYQFTWSQRGAASANARRMNRVERLTFLEKV